MKIVGARSSFHWDDLLRLLFAEMLCLKEGYWSNWRGKHCWINKEVLIQVFHNKEQKSTIETHSLFSAGSFSLISLSSSSRLSSFSLLFSRLSRYLLSSLYCRSSASWACLWASCWAAWACCWTSWACCCSRMALLWAAWMAAVRSWALTAAAWKFSLIQLYDEKKV